jgi:acetyl-CoA acyltransferase
MTATVPQVFLCAHRRTPIGRYGGALSLVRPDDLATRVIDGLLDLHDLPIDEVVFGCANQAGEDNRNIARMAVLLSCLGPKVPALTVNRLCASGLDAVITAARTIRDGAAEIIIAGGVESMSRAPFVMPKAEAPFARAPEIFDTTIGWRFIHPRMPGLWGTDAMPETAETLAAEHDISREDQDRYACLSQSRYDATWHASDILPVIIPGRKSDTIVSADEHPRPTSPEKLAALPTPFRSPGTVTAGNASGVNDGAAGVILASEAAVRKHGLTPFARLGQAASGGVEPRVMGIGPVEAALRLQARTGRPAADHDVIELNEAFAAQVLACTRAWGMSDDDPRLNAKGGAIAMGHPLGMSGARIAGTAARRLAETGGKSALVALCVGVGQGVALELLPA